MKSLDLEAIRNSEGRKITELDVPELNGTLRIRMMSGTDMFRLTEYSVKHPQDFDGQARLLFRFCAVDSDNKTLFDGKTVGLLMDLPSAIVLRLSEEIQKFCGLAESSEDAEKKSEPMTP